MKHIGKSAFHFSLGTLFSRVSGMAREMSMAFVLGTAPAAAAFLVAFRFAYLLRRLFGESALTNGFIPHYQTLKAKDEESAANFFADLFATLGTLLLGLIGLIELVLFFFLHSFSFSDGNREILRLIMLSLPGLLFICLFALHCGFLQCHGRFFLTGAAPIAFNIAWIGTLVFYRNQPPSSITSHLAVALDVAFLFQWAILLPSTWKKLKGRLQAWRLHLFSLEIRKLLGAIVFSIIGIGAAQVNGFIDTLFARAADLSGPAYLAYAMRLEQFPLALFGIAISSAIFPSFAKAVGEGDEQTLQKLLNFGILRTSFLMIPCTIGILLLGAPAINLLFGHGQFDDSSTVKTTICLWAYGLGLFPTSVALLFNQAFFARKDFKTPMLLSCYAIGMNIAFNSLLIFFLQWGSTSVALSTSLAAFVNATILYILYRKRYGSSFVQPQAYLRIFTSTIAGAIACFAVSVWMQDHSLMQILQGNFPIFAHDLKTQALALVLPFFTFVATFLLTGYLVRCKETLSLLSLKSK